LTHGISLVEFAMLLVMLGIVALVVLEVVQHH